MTERKPRPELPPWVVLLPLPWHSSSLQPLLPPLKNEPEISLCVCKGRSQFQGEEGQSQAQAGEHTVHKGSVFLFCTGDLQASLVFPSFWYVSNAVPFSGEFMSFGI